MSDIFAHLLLYSPWEPEDGVLACAACRLGVALEAATQQRRRRIDAFAGPGGELARIDELRKSSAEELLRKLVEAGCLLARHTQKISQDSILLVISLRMSWSSSC